MISGRVSCGVEFLLESERSLVVCLDPCLVEVIIWTLVVGVVLIEDTFSPLVCFGELFHAKL